MLHANWTATLRKLIVDLNKEISAEEEQHRNEQCEDFPPGSGICVNNFT
jgi:hypothetical protein